MNLGRVQVKRSYHKHRHPARFLLVRVQLSSPCLAVPPPKQAKFIAGLTVHSSLTLHMSLQGKLAAFKIWDFGGFLCIGGEKGRVDCSCDAVSIDVEVGYLLIQNAYHQHCIV